MAFHAQPPSPATIASIPAQHGGRGPGGWRGMCHRQPRSGLAPSVIHGDMSSFHWCSHPGSFPLSPVGSLWPLQTHRASVPLPCTPSFTHGCMHSSGVAWEGLTCWSQVTQGPQAWGPLGLMWSLGWRGTRGQVSLETLVGLWLPWPGPPCPVLCPWHCHPSVARAGGAGPLSSAPSQTGPSALPGQGGVHRGGMAESAWCWGCPAMSITAAAPTLLCPQPFGPHPAVGDLPPQWG